MDSLFKRLILINGIGISLLIALCIKLVAPSDCDQTLNLFSDAYAADIKSAGGQSLRLFWSYERWILTYLLPIPGFIFVSRSSAEAGSHPFAGCGKLPLRLLFNSGSIYLHKPWAAYMASNILAVGLTVILVNLFWRGLQACQLRNWILRVGFVHFAVFHPNLGLLPFQRELAAEPGPVGLQKAHLMMT